MQSLKYISEGGCYPDINITGTDMDNQTGLRLNIPKDQTVYIDTVKISNVFLGLRKEGEGRLEIKNLEIHRFGGDAMNFDKNIYIENYNVYDSLPTRPYNQYHCDGIFQCFSNTGISDNVEIKNIKARIKGVFTQGMMLSEAQRYTNFKIGTGKVEIDIEYPYAFVANTLDHSYVNVANNGIKVRKVKPCEHETYNVELIGDNVVNDSIINGEYVDVPNRLLMNDRQKEQWDEQWPNFKPYEVDSDNFDILLYKKAFDAVQRIRARYAKPFTFTNAYRNTKHNKRVGGSPKSDHTYLKGREINCTAFDIPVYSRKMGAELEKLAIEEGFNAIGRYPQRNFIHISMRKPKPSGALYRWGRKW